MILELNPLKWKLPKTSTAATPPDLKAKIAKTWPSPAVTPEMLAAIQAELDQMRAIAAEQEKPVAPEVVDLHAQVHQNLTEEPAKAEEITMSTAPVVIAPKPSVWKSILQHVEEFFDLGLKEVITFTPPAEALAEVLFPEYVGVEQKAKQVIVTVATQLRDTVLTMEQKYSDDTADKKSGPQKLADALQLAGPASIALLQSAGVASDETRITNAINATVAILNTTSAPAAKAA